MKLDEIRRFIELQVDLFLLLKVPHKSLNKRIKEVFVEHVLCSIMGIDINTSECIRYITKKLQFGSTNNVWQYRRELASEGWFMKIYKDSNDKLGKFKIIPNFDYSERTFDPNKKYAFVLEYTTPLEEFKEEFDEEFKELSSKRNKKYLYK